MLVSKSRGTLTIDFETEPGGIRVEVTLPLAADGMSH